MNVSIYDSLFNFYTSSLKLDDMSDTYADNPDVIALNGD